MSATHLIAALDRPGGRRLLGWLGTLRAKAINGVDASVVYDGIWMYRAGDVFFPGSRRFSRPFGPGSVHRLPDLLAASEETWFHLYKPSLEDTILDVGAGRGIDTLVFSKAVGPTGKVVAVEAHPVTFLALDKLCVYNNLQNVARIQTAIMGSPGSVQITDVEKDEENTVICADEENPHCRTFKVQAKTLDQLCVEHAVDKVDFLKMNIEGAERFAILGMNHMIRRTRFVSIACHDFLASSEPRMATKNIVIEFLREHGFRIVTRLHDSRPNVRDHVHAYRVEAGPGLSPGAERP